MNELQPVYPGPKPLLLIGPLQFDAWQDWSEWFRTKMNWKNFTFLRIEYEWEIYCSGHELSLGLLGLNLRITFWYGDREIHDE